MTASGPVSVDPEFQYIMLLFGCTRPTLLLLIFYQSLKFHNFQWRLSILKHFFFSQNCCIGQPTILAILLSKQHAMIINWVVLVWGSSTRTWGKYGAHGGRVQRAPITYSVASRDKSPELSGTSIWCRKYCKIYTTNFHAYFLFCPLVLWSGKGHGECVQREPIRDSGGASSSGSRDNPPG